MSASREGIKFAALLYHVGRASKLASAVSRARRDRRQGGRRRAGAPEAAASPGGARRPATPARSICALCISAPVNEVTQSGGFMMSAAFRVTSRPSSRLPDGFVMLCFGSKGQNSVVVAGVKLGRPTLRPQMCNWNSH